MKKRLLTFGICCLTFIEVIIGQQTKSKPITDATLVNANNDSRSWLTHGLNYNENRFSQLTKINAKNVKKLALSWTFDIAEMKGVEATPIIANGVMYVTGPWSKVFAIDAVTGKKIWQYDPEVPPATLQNACCDAVNRGVAIWEDKIYFGSLDGRLISLNAKNGKKIWEVNTVDKEKPYTITGAPRIIKGKVIIGNGGADLGVRGYLTAYDANTGKQAWRFYSVPGDPSKGFENKAMEMAAKTWTGEWWKSGGGGTMWDAMAFDPNLNLMYVGTGNGSPWNQHFRSPDGGDNLFLSSIVALNPDNGEYIWHYQTTPGENWDYTATQHLILADLKIEGADRKVIMQAPKNGFFYVIDRTNGKFISGEAFSQMNWATGIDYKTGRPIQTPESRYADQPYEAVPGPFGAHNWQSMAFNINTGLVYIPAQQKPITLMSDDKYEYNKVTESMAMATGTGWNTGTVFPGGGKYPTFGKLLAWNPITQKPAWEVQHIAPWNGGVLTTAGNLVFQGTADGRFVAYNAENGTKLWETPTGTGVVAAPVTYEINGQQYVSIAAGWGGAIGSTNRFSDSQITGKVYTFKIGGKSKMPEFPKRKQVLVEGVTHNVSPEGIQEGFKLYMNNCFVCHGMAAAESGGSIPNLGYSHKDVIQNLSAYVLEGASQKQGMPNFKGKLKEDEVEKIKAFIQSMADDVRKSSKK